MHIYIYIYIYTYIINMYTRSWLNFLFWSCSMITNFASVLKSWPFWAKFRSVGIALNFGTSLRWLLILRFNDLNPFQLIFIDYIYYTYYILIHIHTYILTGMGLTNLMLCFYIYIYIYIYIQLKTNLTNNITRNIIIFIR